ILNLAPASPIFMIEPLPYLRSIWVKAADRAFSFSGEIDVAGADPFCVATRAAPYVTHTFRRAKLRRGDFSDSVIIARTFVSGKRHMRCSSASSSGSGR